MDVMWLLDGSTCRVCHTHSEWSLAASAALLSIAGLAPVALDDALSPSSGALASYGAIRAHFRDRHVTGRV